MSVMVESRINNNFAVEGNKLHHRRSEADSGIGTPEEVDLQCTQSPWTYGYPMNSPLVKTAKTDGSQTAFVFELPLSKERDSFLPSPTSTLTRMMTGLSVSGGSCGQTTDTLLSNSDGEQDAESCSTSDSDSSHHEWDKQWSTRIQPRNGLKLTKQASAPDLDLANCNTLYNNTGVMRKTSSYPPAGFRNRSMSTSHGPLYEVPFAPQQQQQPPPLPERSMSLSSSLENGVPSFANYCPPQSRYSPTQHITSGDFICTWSGQLPPRQHRNPTYSTRIFVGGVPWDITEAGLMQAFRPFGSLNIEWPGKEGKHCRHPPKGYVYITFESERSIKALLMSCTHDPSNGGQWYYQVSSRRMRNKEVQIIPWALCDGNSIRCPSPKLDPSRTVFVGGLHGLINADALAHIMDDLFGGVVYAGIDTDKYKYPIGSGRVTFGNQKSFMKAVQAGFIEIKTSKFTKKVQVDPYLEDSLCSICNRIVGPYFCRDLHCFKYYCRSCWQWQHAVDAFTHHRPLTRTTKSSRPL